MSKRTRKAAAPSAEETAPAREAEPVTPAEETAPAAPAPAPKEVRAAGGDRYAVTLLHEAALGEGTRPRGMVMAEIACSVGVGLAEVLTAMANPHLVRLDKKG
jgi:hypothetical protein